MVLNEHHSDVIAFLRVGNTHERTSTSLQKNGLVVQNPIASIFITFFCQDVRCIPGLSQTGTEPSAWWTAYKLTNGTGGLHDISTFIWNLLHVFLAKAMTDELPSALSCRERDWFISPRSEEHTSELQ